MAILLQLLTGHPHWRFRSRNAGSLVYPRSLCPCVVQVAFVYADAEYQRRTGQSPDTLLRHLSLQQLTALRTRVPAVVHSGEYVQAVFDAMAPPPGECHVRELPFPTQSSASHVHSVGIAPLLGRLPSPQAQTLPPTAPLGWRTSRP